jgi:predicted acyltransferase
MPSLSLLEYSMHPLAKRIVSLDVFRGLAIVLMILVNGQGTRVPYPPLEHVSWNGCSLADLGFPFFLFIVGVALVVSMRGQSTKTSSNFTTIIQRSMILFILGLLINAIPYHFHITTLRFYGILQRIAMCYFISTLIYLHTTTKTQVIIFIGILLGYWFVMTVLPVPQFGANQLTQSGTWVAYFDQMFFSSQHLLGHVYDPEGFLSTFPSIATTLSGVLTGTLLLSSMDSIKKINLMLGFGILFVILGCVWDYNFPINKNLWTSSFVLYSSGYSLIIFALCFWLIDVRGYTKWAFPLKIFGMNALFVFVFHVILLKIQSMFSLPLRDGTHDNLRVVITDYFFGIYSTQNAGLFYALCFLVINFLLVMFLYHRKIFIRI